MPVNETAFGNDIKWLNITSPARDKIKKGNKEYGFNYHMLRDCFDADLLPKNDVMKILTILSVFFLPFTFIAVIYGIKVSYMLELKEKWDYVAFWLLMTIVVAIIYIWFKRKKWL